MRVGMSNDRNPVCIGDSQWEADRVSGATRIQTCTAIVTKAKGYGSFTNASISGNTTTAMEARFAADVLSHRPGAIGIMGGVNDMTTNVSVGVWTGAGTSVATTKAKLKAMVEAGQAARARVTLCSFPPVRVTVYLDNAAAYRTAISEIVSETSCEYVDFYSHFIAMDSGTLDGLYIDDEHPNAAGHAEMASYGLTINDAFGQFA